MISIELDLHGFTLVEAIKKIQRTIMTNLKCWKLIIIHGYHNGAVIKDALKDKNNLHNKRVIKTQEDLSNPGRTFIYLRGPYNV